MFVNTIDNWYYQIQIVFTLSIDNFILWWKIKLCHWRMKPVLTYVTYIYRFVDKRYTSKNFKVFNHLVVNLQLLSIYMICIGWVWWHINRCRLFNAKSFSYIYIKYIWFVLVWFYGISTIVGYLKWNLYTYILNKFGFMAYKPL